MKRERSFYALCAIIVSILGGMGLAAPAENGQAVALNPDLPYRARKTSPVTYNVDFCVVVTAPYHTKVLKVWLPLPQTDNGQEVEEKDLRTFPMKVAARIGKEPTFGNRFAYFEFDHPEGAQIIRHRFKIKVWELRWDMDPAKVTAVRKWPDRFGPYLRSEQTVVVNDLLRKVATEVVPAKKGPARDLDALMDWVNLTMKYDHTRASLKASSRHALANHAGHCSDYHGLCAALGRALGYPTRVTYGINTFPKNSPSHCKLEAYLPPYGWVSFDVSETQHLIKAIQNAPGLGAAKKARLLKAARERFRRGFRDNTWFVQIKGTDYDLAPPASRRVPVVRTIYAEADGVALPDPDPANKYKHEFAWMTVHRYQPDRPVKYPFKDWHDLLPQP
jgi:transglutaminase-like putative cysteine protease